MHAISYELCMLGDLNFIILQRYYSSLHNDNISENEEKPLTVSQGDSVDLIWQSVIAKTTNWI